MQDEEKFSDDPAENMRMENEFLKLKLKAQYGDAFHVESNTDLPPDIENQFLKRMIAFEANHGDAEVATVYECIGRPAYKSAEELNDFEIPGELQRINAILNEHNIVLNICDGPYPDRLIYTFITEELFAEEANNTVDKEIRHHFTYEEFHPNHKAEITKRTHEFLNHWFTCSFDEYASEISRQIVIPDGRQMDKEEVLEKLRLFFDAFQGFKNDGYNIDEVSFEINPETFIGLGFAEGMLKYDALLEKGEQVHYQGPYKLYMQMENNYWDIFCFIMPGFNW
ncbi:hypothetical protein QWZ08_24520 [Ferruginibacter paludis]|uniref:hypothetical protein n=1 Tax=Ferruginibacter paludis TaxID=1310417 RepID=UPI0025B37A25|nr:hypothetical protein [Ferruginibacter paludis]MDN3658831.1 hypothetical protein [Ferruginibacter paludis]